MSNRIETLVTPEEMALQQAYVAKIAALPQKPATYFIVTYGCQMNAHDSEKLAGMLREMGLLEAPSKEEADFVLYNTCCIRDNAQRRALGNVTWLKELKKRNPALLIAVCGCMVQQAGMGETLRKQYPFVDIAFGTHNLHRFPEMMYHSLTSKAQVVEILAQENLIAEGLPVKRLHSHHAYITIMYGCNNYCSYCIVPYVRGRERSRSPEAILREAETLQKEGVKEIMLLGQNVNSYAGSGDSPMTFAGLLRRLDDVGIPRIRFMTSHPKDLSDELIEVMASGKHICNHFHLPVQSGNDRILSEMNRRYTRERYLERLASLRRAVPGIGITSDLIVAFPGETEAEFQDTLSLVDEAAFDAAFTFIYSPRQGTKAADMPGQIQPEVATDRIERLIALQEKKTAEIHDSLLGITEEVLVESLSKRDGGMVSGKGRRNITVNFPGTVEDVGKMIPVKVTSSGSNTLRGERVLNKSL